LFGKDAYGGYAGYGKFAVYGAYGGYGAYDAYGNKNNIIKLRRGMGIKIILLECRRRVWE